MKPGFPLSPLLSLFLFCPFHSVADAGGSDDDAAVATDAATDATDAAATDAALG